MIDLKHKRLGEEGYVLNAPLIPPVEWEAMMNMINYVIVANSTDLRVYDTLNQEWVGTLEFDDINAIIPNPDYGEIQLLDGTTSSSISTYDGSITTLSATVTAPFTYLINGHILLADRTQATFDDTTITLLVNDIFTDGEIIATYNQYMLTASDINSVTFTYPEPDSIKTISTVVDSVAIDDGAPKFIYGASWDDDLSETVAYVLSSTHVLKYHTDPALTEISATAITGNTTSIKAPLVRAGYDLGNPLYFPVILSDDSIALLDLTTGVMSSSIVTNVVSAIYNTSTNTIYALTTTNHVEILVWDGDNLEYDITELDLPITGVQYLSVRYHGGEG